MVGGFQNSFEEAGGEIVQKLWIPFGYTDFSDVLAKIRKDADAVFICSTSSVAERLPQQYKKSGINLPVVAYGTGYDEAILPHLGDESLGVISVATYAGTLKSAANEHFSEAYKAKYNADPSGYAANAYTSMMMICKAIESLHGDVSDKEKLMAAMRNVSLKDAPGGPLKPAVLEGLSFVPALRAVMFLSARIPATPKLATSDF